MILYIQEHYSGKIHRRHIDSCSCSYQVEGNYLVVRAYYTNKVLHRFNIRKYGSISYWVEQDEIS